MALECDMGKMREVRAFPLRLPWSTGAFGMTHFCAVLFLNNSNQCEEPEEEEGGSEQPWPHYPGAFLPLPEG